MKSLKLYLILASVFIIVYILALSNKPKPIDWKESYLDKEKAPFGTYVLFKQLTDIFPGANIISYRKPIYSVINEDSIKNSSYIIIANKVQIEKSDFKQLTKYISQGNDVFISATSFGKTMEDLLKIVTNSSYNYKLPLDTLHFLNPNLDIKTNYIFDKNTAINFFSAFDTLKAKIIGENERHQVNMLKYPFGNGSLILSANPLLFTNYTLLKPVGENYAAIALAHIKNTKNIVWDEYYTQGNLNVENESPMRVFFSKPYLQWAYYITLISLLAYVIYGVKRNQRVIPVILPLENKTIEFVNVVGQVYFEQHDNLNISQKKISYLLEHIRTLYNIKTNVLDEEFIKGLAHKTGINDEFVNELIKYIIGFETKKQVTNAELIKLNKLIEEFYLKASK